jgi:hypothetical protein
MSHTRISLDLDRGISPNGAALRLFRLTPKTIHVSEEFKFWLNYGNGYGGASSRHTFAALIGRPQCTFVSRVHARCNRNDSRDDS